MLVIVSPFLPFHRGGDDKGEDSLPLIHNRPPLQDGDTVHSVNPTSTLSPLYFLHKYVKVE